MWWIVQLCLLGLSATQAADFKAFDDTILFKINWPGSNTEESSSSSVFDKSESLLLTSNNNEKYKCTLPMSWETPISEDTLYKGPNPLQLLSPLFTQMSCSYRLEPYWTYELCHGRYIRQYHEEREGRKTKLQDYYLGRWTKEALEKYSAELDLQAEKIQANDIVSIPVKKIEGINMPYLQINMTDGTVCDLNGQPRTAQLLYVCYPHGKHEIYSLDEVSTCEYEIIILSPHLCQHPRYKPQESSENEIKCQPVEGTTIPQPRNLMELEAESMKLRHENILQDLEALEARIKGEGWPMEIHIESMDESTGKIVIQTPPPPVLDTKLMEDFLSGEHCLTGGSGWWKYELCHGKRVDQFHDDKENGRTTIHLGFFDLNKHLAWLEKNPHKKPKPKYLRKFVYHFYSDGSICESTGQPRHVEVKLRCMDKGTSPTAVALYLLEPKVCEYMLGVESPILCPLIENADENGLFDIVSDRDAEEESTSAMVEEAGEENEGTL